MATKVLGARVPDDLAEWAKSYAESRGITTQALLEEALRSFKEDCEAGVPEIRAAIKRQSSVKPAALAALQGVGDCPKREPGWGHVWMSPREDPERPCVYCGLRGRLNRPVGEAFEEHPNHLDQATKERAELFSHLQAPMQSGTGKPRELSAVQQARAAAIVADKKRRDAEAVEAGTARPGQIIGVKAKT